MPSLGVTPCEYLDSPYLSRNYNDCPTPVPDTEDCTIIWTKRRNMTDGWTDTSAVAVTAVCIASNADSLKKTTLVLAH